MLKRGLAVWLFCTILMQHLPLNAQGAGKINIVIVEGEGAINNVRQRVAREPIVQVEDENRKPVAGAAVTFLLPNQGAGASFANGAQSLTITTDAQGRAVARGLRPNNVNGQYEIRVNASHQGRTANAVISQTNAITATTAATGGISAKANCDHCCRRRSSRSRNRRSDKQREWEWRCGGTPSRTVIVPGTPNIGGPQ